MDDSRIKDISSLLSAFFDEEKLRKGGQYASIFGSWKNIAGERLAAHSRIVDILNNLLVVEAEHPGWIQLLQFRQGEILRLINQRFPQLELRGVVFRLGRTPEPGSISADAAVLEGRIGPFGPGARPPSPVGPSSGQEGSTGGSDALPGRPEGKSASLEDIGDQSLRELLGSLKKTIDHGRK